MASPKPFEPVLYFCAVLAVPDYPIEKLEDALAVRFGPVDFRSEPSLFTATDYYAPTMGGSLIRRFISFSRLGDPEELADRKHFTNRLEAEEAAASGLQRPVNIDPGYLDSAHMVLASAKPFAHRVPLSGGIHAQLEYLFHRGGVEFLKWTFPEYRQERVTAFFLRLKRRYRELLGSSQ